MFKLRLIGIFATLFVLVSTTTFAKSEPSLKFKEGFKHTLTAWQEIPNAVERKHDEYGASGLLTGASLGLGRAFAKLAAGIYEVTTAILPIPEDYETVWKENAHE